MERKIIQLRDGNLARIRGNPTESQRQCRERKCLLLLPINTGLACGLGLAAAWPGAGTASAVGFEPFSAIRR